MFKSKWGIESIDFSYEPLIFCFDFETEVVSLQCSGSWRGSWYEFSQGRPDSSSSPSSSDVVT